MADIPAACTHASNFADRVRREIVVKHKAFPLVAVYIIENLLVKNRTKRCYYQRLCLASGKKGRSVSPLKNPYLAVNVPDVLSAPSVQADTLIKNRRAQDLVLHILKKDVEKFFLVFISKLG